MGKARQAYEAPAIGAATARMMRALVRRAGTGDTEALEELLKLETVLAAAIREAGKAAHDDAGYSWAQLAQVTGTTRAACAKRFS